MAFEIETTEFSGPLDLMLHLIREQQLDIFEWSFGFPIYSEASLIDLNVLSIFPSISSIATFFGVLGV